MNSRPYEEKNNGVFNPDHKAGVLSLEVKPWAAGGEFRLVFQLLAKVQQKRFWFGLVGNSGQRLRLYQNLESSGSLKPTRF